VGKEKWKWWFNRGKKKGGKEGAGKKKKASIMENGTGKPLSPHEKVFDTCTEKGKKKEKGGILNKTIRIVGGSYSAGKKKGKKKRNKCTMILKREKKKGKRLPRIEIAVGEEFLLS